MDKEELRIWFDACFDLPHFGHANALRQAKKLGDKLIVGVHSDAEMLKHKGAPFYNESERYRLARGLRWIDQVVEDVPYVTRTATMDKYNCQLCAHGDDLTPGADGVDSYQEVKDAGRFRIFGRTIGISSTALIERLLEASIGEQKEVNDQPIAISPYTGTCIGSTNGYFTSSMIASFYDNRRPRRPDDKVVYVSGAFDLFHAGHLAFLEAAKALGTFLIVGINSDDTVKASKKCKGRPFLSLHERVLGVLGYRCVDDVFIGAPYEVTSDLLDTFNVSVVCHGTATAIDNRYDEAKKRGILQLVDSGCQVTTKSLIRRIAGDRDKYIARNQKKQLKELAAIEKATAN